MQPMPTRPNVAAVATGGVAGATLRWAVGSFQDVAPGTWPWPTLVVNILGCLLIGVAMTRVPRETWRWDALVTGALGGFTTMSSFAIELNDMVDLDRTSLAIVYGGVTFAAGAAAVAGGARLADGASPAGLGDGAAS